MEATEHNNNNSNKNKTTKAGFLSPESPWATGCQA